MPIGCRFSIVAPDGARSWVTVGPTSICLEPVLFSIPNPIVSVRAVQSLFCAEREP